MPLSVRGTDFPVRAVGACSEAARLESRRRRGAGRCRLLSTARAAPTAQGGIGCRTQRRPGAGCPRTVRARAYAVKGWSGLLAKRESGALRGFTGVQLLTVEQDRKSTRLNSSHVAISYAVFCL